MTLEKRIGRSFGRTLFAGAIGLASFLYSGKALAQQWPEPTNLGAPMNTTGAELNPERTCDGSILVYERKGTDPNATRIDGRKLYTVMYNPTTQQFENEQPYDIAISDPAVPGASESDLTISCDGRSEIFVRWGTRSFSYSSLAFAQRSAPGAVLDNLTTILENWDVVNSVTQEMSPTISDSNGDSRDGFTLHFIRYCDEVNMPNGCQASATGVYRSTYDPTLGFSTPMRVGELDALINLDSNECPGSICLSDGYCQEPDPRVVPCTPNGRIVSIGMQPDGSAAVVGYIPTPDDLDVRGGVDLAFIPYDIGRGQFNLTTMVKLHGPIDPNHNNVDINTAADDSGATLYLGAGATQPSIYLHTTNSWPGAQGAEDLYVTPVPPAPCVPIAAQEISANTSPFPLLIRRQGTDLLLSYEEIPQDPCGSGENLYTGTRALGPPPAFSATSTLCHIAGTPDGAGRRTLTVPISTNPLDCFLISSSTRAGESPLGYASNGTQTPMPINPPACGPMP